MSINYKILCYLSSYGIQHTNKLEIKSGSPLRKALATIIHPQIDWKWGKMSGHRIVNNNKGYRLNNNSYRCWELHEDNLF